jgi:hypothetical protein
MAQQEKQYSLSGCGTFQNRENLLLALGMQMARIGKAQSEQPISKIGCAKQCSLSGR